LGVGGYMQMIPMEYVEKHYQPKATEYSFDGWKRKEEQSFYT
jgi:hypothetical protein